jgi:hypothetical protein
MKKITKGISAAVLAGGLILGATACSSTPNNEQRAKDQKASQISNSLEKQNAEMKRDKEEDPNAIRYVILLNYGKTYGYYVAKGKISSSSSQVGPETEIVYGGGNGNVVDSAKDDGTYGPGDPGIFFFTTDGMMVETSLDYVVTDRPIGIGEAPLLGGKQP